MPATMADHLREYAPAAWAQGLRLPAPPFPSPAPAVWERVPEVLSGEQVAELLGVTRGILWGHLRFLDLMVWLLYSPPGTRRRYVLKRRLRAWLEGRVPAGVLAPEPEAVPEGPEALGVVERDGSWLLVRAADGTLLADADGEPFRRRRSRRPLPEPPVSLHTRDEALTWGLRHLATAGLWAPVTVPPCPVVPGALDAAGWASAPALVGPAAATRLLGCTSGVFRGRVFSGTALAAWLVRFVEGRPMIDRRRLRAWAEGMRPTLLATPGLAAPVPTERTPAKAAGSSRGDGERSVGNEPPRQAGLSRPAGRPPDRARWSTGTPPARPPTAEDWERAPRMCSLAWASWLVDMPASTFSEVLRRDPALSQRLAFRTPTTGHRLFFSDRLRDWVDGREWTGLRLVGGEASESEETCGAKSSLHL